MQKKIGLYARVSTNNGRQDVEVQLQPLREYCKQRSFSIYREYIDHLSGANDDRPSLKQMMDDARKRKMDTVLVWKFDRFARSTKSLVLALEEFRQLGIDFISYSENIDTSTPMGKVVFTIISSLAEFERSLIRERVVAGLNKAKADGVQLGRPKVGFDVKRAVELKLAGFTWARLADEMKVSSATLRRFVPPLLKNQQNTTPQIIGKYAKI